MLINYIEIADSKPDITQLKSSEPFCHLDCLIRLTSHIAWHAIWGSYSQFRKGLVTLYRAKIKPRGRAHALVKQGEMRTQTRAGKGLGQIISKINIAITKTNALVFLYRDYELARSKNATQTEREFGDVDWQLSLVSSIRESYTIRDRIRL